HISRWHESDLVLGVKVVSMLQVLVVNQTSVPFAHRTSVVSVAAGPLDIRASPLALS
ncbi:hypothetical protein Tco_1497952, partial [Tanacetum coccineum]